jgi:hypothetical protein
MTVGALALEIGNKMGLGHPFGLLIISFSSGFQSILAEP